VFIIGCWYLMEADSNVVEREVTVDPTAAAAANPPPTPAPSSAVF